MRQLVQRARSATSRAAPYLRVLAVLAALLVPALTLPALPEVDLTPLLVALVPWTLGKYLLCPLRWHAVSASGRRRWWHLRAYAESELLGILTPGHVGADLWRMKRLTGTGMTTPAAAADVTLDRCVGAAGLVVFVAAAGASLPLRLVLTAAGLAVVALLVLLLVHRLRPGWLPRREWPPPRRFALGVVLTIGYQLTICGLLVGAVAATGHSVPVLPMVAAFGASQIAGAVPGPHGASPRDGALVLGLVALGMPTLAAVGAVALVAAVAWAPALLLGGTSLLARRVGGSADVPTGTGGTDGTDGTDGADRRAAGPRPSAVLTSA